VLYQHGGEGAIADGQFGPVAQFQQALARALVACSKPAPALTPDGTFGGGTAKAIQAFMACPQATALAADDPARRGALSEGLWRLLMPAAALPDVDARVQSLVLTYEATDYVRAEWNFCQNKPAYDPKTAGSACYSNDPRSYLTWGPRGATAGHGREVQAILWLVKQRDPTALATAFGDEADVVDRLVALAPAQTEKLLCSVWIDPQRRAAWKASFGKIGAMPAARSAYDAYYRTAPSDGSKIQTFFRLYAQAGLTPTEVDYGFFVDRATHSTPPATAAVPDLARQLSAAIAGHDQPHARARLWLARTLIPANKALAADRKGRDMAFILDALGSDPVITAEERSQWAARGKVKASDAGLSDDRTVPGFVPAAIDLAAMPKPLTTELSPAEQAACPAAVLKPLPPPPK
jgi:hypothetical protein